MCKKLSQAKFPSFCPEKISIYLYMYTVGGIKYYVHVHVGKIVLYITVHTPVSYVNISIV